MVGSSIGGASASAGGGSTRERPPKPPPHLRSIESGQLMELASPPTRPITIICSCGILRMSFERRASRSRRSSLIEPPPPIAVESGGIAGVLKSLHPATVHFPIALLLMAALTELFVMARRTPEREAAVKIMIYGGAAGAVVAALFGWIHTGLWFGGDTVMQLHRWNGMLIAALSLVAAWIAFQNPQSRLAFRLTLFPIAALLIAV